MADVWERLFTAAETARRHAHAPYSRFHVGAALLLADGRIVRGCNVESASYGLTVCAERNALAMMVLDGGALRACAIVVDSREPTPPCGACRQMLAEFADADLPIRSRTMRGEESQYTLGELLPHAFTSAGLTSPQTTTVKLKGMPKKKKRRARS